MGIGSKKHDLLSTTACLDFLKASGVVLGVKHAPEKDIDREFKHYKILDALKPQERHH